MSKYIKKAFSPHLFHDWTHLFRNCTPEQRSELLLAITDYPEYEPNIEVPIWDFIKSQLENQYQALTTKSQQMTANRNNGKQKSTEANQSQPKSTEVDESRQIKTRIKTGTGIKIENEIKTGNQIENQNEIQIEKNTMAILKQAADALSVKKANDCILVDSSFSFSLYPVFKPYIESVTPEIVESVENWLRRSQKGKQVTVGFITRQFTNFANRQNKPIFKEQGGK